jgi:hypothetical protein
MFPPRHISSWPRAESTQCTHVANTELATERNQLASRILAPLLAPSTSDYSAAGREAHLELMSTFDKDLALADQHAKRPGGDCTHYCLHSDAARGWLSELLAVLARRT